MSDYRRAAGTAFIILFGLMATRWLQAAPIGSQLTSTEKQQLQREARLVVDLLQNHHYSGRAFREIENREMVARFLAELDPGADFFTTDDAEFIHRRFDRTLKSVYLFRGDLQPAFEIFDLFAQRARERLAAAAQRLNRDFDLTVEESFHTPHEAEAAAAGLPAEQRWEQRLKDSVLREIIAGRTPADARETVARHYREIARRIAAVDAFAVRERFFDAVIRSYDPHSGYFSGDSAREFAVDMENAVVGIGLDLRKEDDRCVVAAVQPGGPADLHSPLASGDTVIALAEGDGPWVDAAAKRLRELVPLVRGEAGAKLRVAYSPEGTDTRREVTLEKTRVVLAADRAHGAISTLSDPAGRSRKVGVILLPSFYTGGEGATLTSAAQDIRELLDQMTTQKIDGLVIDLRNNPGGALTEATAISQLFLSGGNMMLSRGTDGKLKEHKLKDAPPTYAGPLVVLTSGRSASASEILAGAMKFHQRALIVGGASTFGKGTAQAFIPLGKLPGVDVNLARDWGTLRLTSDRFYLPDGQAIQRVGVTSQVILPDYDAPGWKREVELPHALSEESVPPPASFRQPDKGATSAALLQYLGDRATADFLQLPEWDLWRREAAEQKQQYDRQDYSLVLATRQAQWAETLAQYQATQRIRRTLTVSAAFATQPLEIAQVQAAYAAHEARWRAPDPAGGTLLNRLHGGGFFVATDCGHLRNLRLADIPVTAYYGDAEVLAAAFTQGAGRPIAAATARDILQELALLEHKTDATLLTAVDRLLGSTLPAPAQREGTEALLRRLSELDGEMCRERPALDVPLREAQRLAAAWAGWLAEKPNP